MFELGPVQAQRQIATYLAAGRLMEAMVLAKVGVERFPQWLEFRLLLAEAYRLGGKLARAREELEALLKLDPEFPGARQALNRLA